MARSREIPEKCRRCAPLSPAEARVKHPNCWDDKLCTARRFYINNRSRINQKRSRKEYINFLNIAKGSAGEIRSLLRVALEIGYLNEQTYSQLSQ